MNGEGPDEGISNHLSRGASSLFFFIGDFRNTKPLVLSRSSFLLLVIFFLLSFTLLIYNKKKHN